MSETCETCRFWKTALCNERRENGCVPGPDGWCYGWRKKKPTISDGYCKCGCGQLVSLAKWNNKRRGHVKGMPLNYLPGHPANGKKEANGRWKGGRRTDKDGYVLILAKEHPRADCRGYLREHILIAERVLGRPLKDDECVHHLDTNPANNNPGNLVICPDQAYHMLLHQRTRALHASGNANYRKCKICKKYDDPDNMVLRKGSRSYLHKSCWAERARIQRIAKNADNGSL